MRLVETWRSRWGGRERPEFTIEDAVTEVVYGDPWDRGDAAANAAHYAGKAGAMLGRLLSELHAARALTDEAVARVVGEGFGVAGKLPEPDAD